MGGNFGLNFITCEQGLTLRAAVFTGRVGIAPGNI